MRVFSTHEVVEVMVADLSYHLEFVPETPGVFVAEVPDQVARHLLDKIGLAGGYWSHDVPVSSEPRIEAVAQITQPSDGVESSVEPEPRTKRKK